MTFSRTRLLTVTPLVLSAISTGAAAQDASSVTPLVIENTQAVNADVLLGSNVTFPLEISIPDDGTYVFSVPAGSGIQLVVNGQTLFGETSTDSDEAPKAIVSMQAGTYVIQVSGEDLTLADLADVTANVLGMPVASIESIATLIETTDVASSSSTGGSAAAQVAAGAVFSPTSSTDTTDSFVPTVLNDETVSSSSDDGGNSVDGAMLRDAIRTAVASAFVGGSSSSSGGGSTDDGVGSGGTPNAGTDQPTVVDVPIVIGANQAQSSALSPPTGVTLTQAIEIVGGPTENGVVASHGQTIFGAVMDPTTYDIVTVTIEPSDREVTVDVGPSTGQFAFRLFPEDMTTGNVSVSLVAGSSEDETLVTVPVTYDYVPGSAADGVTQALSRLTYGPTIDLYSRVRTIGFEAYVNEQLNPGRVNDATFDAMDVDQLVADIPNNYTGAFRREMAHRLAYGAYTEKQLKEVMGDFWSNHFFASIKNTRMYQQVTDDREYYRNNAFGNFEDLLLYSARSPLMSQFLDNDQSLVGNINENYGREILELHTVGVDGGYNDDDVIAVSRIFTGWRYERTNPDEDVQLYEFSFESDRHDTDDKVLSFLNTTIPGRSGDAGVQEGEELIAMLADDPRTHEYVCGKIVERFVSDVAPDSFVDICTTTWAETDGDMREVLRDILLAPEFLEEVAARGTKAKTPFEYTISVMRALGVVAEPSSGYLTFSRFYDMSVDGGYDPIGFGLPTGLDEAGSSWINSASMLGVYREATEVATRTGTYDIDLGAMTAEAGLETAEEVAAFLLTIANADLYTLEEYEAMVDILKGEDGIFEPLTTDESFAFERAGGLMIVLPSFYLQ